MAQFKPLKKFRAPAAQVKKVKKIIAGKWHSRWKDAMRMAFREERNVVTNRNGFYTYDRDYERNYNPFFSRGLGPFFGKNSPMNIHDALKIIATEIGSGTKRNPFRILEDGSGHGVALFELNEKLKGLGIHTEAHATSLKANPKIEELKKSGKINKITTGNAEFFVPTKPVDAIVSVAGSLQHSVPMIAKEHLLKYAYSLKRGGIMMVSFHPGWLYSKKLYSRRKPDKFMLGMIKSFEKRGFKAMIYPDPKNYDKEAQPFVNDMPPHMLIVRRIN